MAIDVPTRFADFDDFWGPFTVDIAPAPGYASRLPPDRREALRERLRATLPTGPKGPSTSSPAPGRSAARLDARGLMLSIAASC